MAKRRPSGDGMVRRRDDGRWEGRIVIGHKKNGDPIFHHDYANTQKELMDKLHLSIERYRDVELTEDSRMTLSEWLDRFRPSPSGATEETAAAQEEMGAMMQTGAAVASMMKDSFSRETLNLSVTGRITEPTVRQLK